MNVMHHNISKYSETSLNQTQEGHDGSVTLT